MVPNGTELMEKTALVCGASKGIGLATATRLAQAGAQVIALARDQKSLEESFKDFNRVRIMAQDLSDLSSLKDKIRALIKEMGGIDIVVNNAGGPKSGPLQQASSEEFLVPFRSHLMASHEIMQMVSPGMKKRNFGRFINIISTSVKAPIENLGVSNTIRGAMASWAKSLSLELGPFGITVNNVLPGYTDTERLSQLKKASAERLKLSESEVQARWLMTIPAGRLATADEIANAILFLASPEASYINGINLPVDGGRTPCL